MRTRLILIDGLPGSGKTTTASWIASRLQSEGQRVALYPENHPEHPLHVGGALHPSGYNSGASFFEQYTPGRFVEESLERWEAFVGVTIDSNEIGVLDSYPFQSDIRLLLQLDAPAEAIYDHAARIEALTAPLHPVLVYFHHRELADALRNVATISEQRGSAWSEYVVEMATISPYAINRKLTGFDGALAILAGYRELTGSLLSRSHIPRLVLEECAGRWEECYRQIEEFLKTA